MLKLYRDRGEMSIVPAHPDELKKDYLLLVLWRNELVLCDKKHDCVKGK